MLTRNFWNVFASLFAGLNTAIEITDYSGNKQTNEYVFYNNGPYQGTVSMLTVAGNCTDSPTLKKVITNEWDKGTAFGDGTAEPTIDDYNLSGNIIKTLTGTANVTTSTDDNGVEITSVFTLTNTGTEPVTISEVGRFGGFRTFLVERVLLETPVTLVPNGIGQVTFTTRFNYPWA